MTVSDFDQQVVARGKALFAAIRNEKPSLFDTGTWTGKVMDWAMRHEKFKTQLFRFVDLFPALHGNEQLTRHIREYFGSDLDLPPVLAAGIKAAGALGGFGGSMLGKALTANINEMARQFIVGATTAEAVEKLGLLRRDGFAFTVDLLGEATLSHEEELRYADTCLELLESLNRAQSGWSSLSGDETAPTLDWGEAPRINISVKPSALFCQADPRNFEGSVTAILERLERIFAGVMACRAFLCIDMESTRMKEITLELYRRLKLAHRDYPYLGIALQAYLHDTDRDLAELLNWAEREGTQISVRLVKGAYWDYEVIRAKQNGWQPPVRTIKADTDAAFERQAQLILEHHRICHLSCASHNIRSIASVMTMAEKLAVPKQRYEFQVLYGMAEPVRRVLLRETGRLRLYAPYGELVPGMGYLVRRLLENTSNESFLRRSFSDGENLERLLENPLTTASLEKQKPPQGKSAENQGSNFTNEPAADFTDRELREAFPLRIAGVRRQFGASYPLFINGQEVETGNLLDSLNPADPSEVVGKVHLAGREEAAAAIAAARNAFPSWRNRSPGERAALLTRTAALARKRLVELAAWQVLEIGKQWDQAYADVAEAIDFLEYYAGQMLHLARPHILGDIPGELNRLIYEPCGVAVVISPWNFPLAISCGMTAAALVTGNCVVFKPSSLTPVIGHHLGELFREAGVPDGVFNFLPGRGGDIGAYLVEHPEVNLIAFTGSVEAGLGIIERAARHQSGQVGIKRVISEMGGKNAAIIDDDADLDEAIPQLLQSAFGFQGQKCSACSRIIVLDSIYHQFLDRFVKAAAAITIGPAEDPAYFMGPVADREQQEKILRYIEIGINEGTLLYRSYQPEGGYYVPLVILGDITPEMVVARDEIFGPVLTIMRATDFDDALAIANQSNYALTGSLFSRSPTHLDRACREFRVGNLYLNRGCTGALVERQPFGGFRLSGGGTKAGGSDYLLHFLNPRVITENTMRRGFAPHREE